MTKLPRPTGAEMVRFLQRKGFSLIRIRGSHHYLSREGVKTSVPVHGSRALKIGTLHGIPRDIELSPGEFVRLWTGRG